MALTHDISIFALRAAVLFYTMTATLRDDNAYLYFWRWWPVTILHRLIYHFSPHYWSVAPRRQAETNIEMMVINHPNRDGAVMIIVRIMHISHFTTAICLVYRNDANHQSFRQPLVAVRKLWLLSFIIFCHLFSCIIISLSSSPAHCGTISSDIMVAAWECRYSNFIRHIISKWRAFHKLMPLLDVSFDLRNIYFRWPGSSLGHFWYRRDAHFGIMARIYCRVGWLLFRYAA